MLTDCYAVVFAFVQFFRFFFLKTKEAMCMGKRPISSSAVTYSLLFSVCACHFFFPFFLLKNNANGEGEGCSECDCTYLLLLHVSVIFGFICEGYKGCNQSALWIFISFVEVLTFL